MKKKINSLLIVLMIVCTGSIFAKTNDKPLPISTNIPSTNSILIIERLEEINQIDQSMLSGSEKRALKNELKELDKELKEQSLSGSGGGGVYISLGGILIILLLLIIIL